MMTIEEDQEFINATELRDLWGGKNGDQKYTEFEEAIQRCKRDYEKASPAEQYQHAIAEMLTAIHHYVWVGDLKGFFARKLRTIYIRNVERDMEARIHSYYYFDKKTPNKTDVENIKAIVRANRHFPITDFDADRTKIHFKNTVLDLTTFECDKLDDDLSFIEIPHEYHPECSYFPHKFVQFLNLLISKSKDPQTMLDTIWSIIGYSLSKNINMQKAFIFTSKKGGTFKSALINIINALVGKDNTSKISLAQLAEDRFAKSSLCGKQLNYFTDLDKRMQIRNIGVIKDMITDEELPYEEKFMTPTKCLNITKHLYSCNGLPFVSSNYMDEAFARRWVIIDFEQIVPEDKQIKDWELINIINDEDEMEGILVLAVDALRMLYEEGSFISAPAAVIMDRWRMETDIIYKFVKTQCWLQKCVDKDLHETDVFQVQSDLFGAFTDFQESEGNIFDISQKNFTSELQKMGYLVKQKHIDNKHQKAYIGIHAKNCGSSCNDCPCYSERISKKIQDSQSKII